MSSCTLFSQILYFSPTGLFLINFVFKRLVHRKGPSIGWVCSVSKSFKRGFASKANQIVLTEGGGGTVEN